MIIELPQVGESVTEGIIGVWLKQVGDEVAKYEPLVEVVTDKVSMEMPSPVTGVLTGILVNEGETVPMGAPIAEIKAEGEAPDDGQQSTYASSVGITESASIDRTGTLLKDVAPVGPTGSGGPANTPPAKEAQRSPKRYSPAVQRLASEHGVDLSLVAGTGIGGRLTRKDVQRHIVAAGGRNTPLNEAVTEEALGKERPDEERVPLTPVRRIIAENMVRSSTQIPQAWTMMEVDVSGLVQVRKRTAADFRLREGIRLTYLAYVLKAVAESLQEHRLLNSEWGADAIILKRRINIGVAVAAPVGLVVPVVHDADSLSLAGLAKAIDDLAVRARRGKLVVEDVQGGTFTVNNTGALGSVAGRALINHPQAAILNTEAIVRRPVVIDDAIAIRSMMNLCLTFDHRVLDGAEAGAFVADVKRRFEAIRPEVGV